MRVRNFLPEPVGGGEERTPDSAGVRKLTPAYGLRLLCVSLLLAGLTAGSALLGFEFLVDATEPPAVEIATSTLVLDRNDKLLRAFTVADGRWRLPTRLEDIDPKLVEMVLAFEDKRFREHSGVDPKALIRAGVQMLANGRIISGGSTISMQLVRLLESGSTRSARGKLRQILAALALERRTKKEDILASYLSLAPYGGNIEGVRAATLAWFGKEPKRLTAAEAALLVALPQSPEARRPDRDPAAARRARDRVLARVRDAGVIDAAEEMAARSEPVPLRRLLFPMLAPHLAERLVKARPSLRVHRTTLDRDLQRRLERLAAERAQALGSDLSVAILAVDHSSGEVLASVGSAGLLDERRDGFIDMTRAVRSPGSTLKPLIYGLAFEAGIAHPESLIEDRPTGFAGYVPTNFDREFQGTVTIRQALQLSLNVPAVKVLREVGPARLVARMRRGGAQPRLSDLAPPGLAIGLGGLGMSLTDLTHIYAAIARGGMPVALREAQGHGAPPANAKRVLDERSAWYLGSILSGAPMPSNAASGGLAFKTGTSYGYRDAWALGFDGNHTVGVWVGRPDAAPVAGLVGLDAAAPILLDVFARLGDLAPLPAAPPGALLASTANLPPPLRRVQDPGALESAGLPGPEIAFPPDGARVELGKAAKGMMPLVLKVRNGSPPFIWLANGAPIQHEAFSRSALWVPDGPGFANLSVVDGRGLSSRVSVFLD